MLSTSRAQVVRLAQRSLAIGQNKWLGSDYVDTPAGKIKEGTKQVGSMGFKQAQEVAKEGKEKKGDRQRDRNVVREPEAPAENIRTDGAGRGPLGFKNPAGMPKQGQKTTISQTRQLHTTGREQVGGEQEKVKDSAVDTGQATSIDAAGEIPGGFKNPADAAKREKITREALDNIGKKSSSTKSATDKVKEAGGGAMEGIKHAAEKMMESTEKVMDRAQKWLGGK